jgi:hypothetical protein
MKGTKLATVINQWNAPRKGSIEPMSAMSVAYWFF